MWTQGLRGGAYGEICALLGLSRGSEGGRGCAFPWG